MALKTHSMDPVPYAMATGAQLAGKAAPLKFGEAAAALSGDTIREGHSVVEQLLALA